MHRGPKRNVCRYYMASGQCQYGDQCQFLHVRSGQHAEHRKPPPGELPPHPALLASDGDRQAELEG